MPMKTCPDCGELKDDNAFGRNRTRPDGLSFYCLDCNRRRNSAWYRQSRAALGRVVRDHSWVPEGFRWCPGCRQAVAHEHFSRNATQASGFGSLCRACNRRSSGEAYWKRRYGLSKDDVAIIRAAQGDLCSICGDPAPEHLDHDHASGAVRALLCQRCNFGLGQFRDDPALLQAAADYVERHRVSVADPVTAVPQRAARASHRSRVQGRVAWLVLETSGRP